MSTYTDIATGFMYFGFQSPVFKCNDYNTQNCSFCLLLYIGVKPGLLVYGKYKSIDDV
jgi:hypothetical protein